ncbi:Hypothetical predicted protein [Pelobates cultripes]|uniref:Uncharacterized protein n=1 Tax=Pelobates cultripes TaxID=61616 RepID=A0AAD1SJW0_PELCU|nr:Hypothetical predicted protein [Pelobates cultripes]
MRADRRRRRQVIAGYGFLKGVDYLACPIHDQPAQADAWSRRDKLENDRQASSSHKAAKWRMLPTPSSVMPGALSNLGVAPLQPHDLPQRLLPRPQTHRIHGKSLQGPNEALDELPKALCTSGSMTGRLTPQHDTGTMINDLPTCPEKDSNLGDPRGDYSNA